MPTGVTCHRAGVIRAIGDLQVQRYDDVLDNLPGERQILLGWAARNARQL